MWIVKAIPIWCQKEIKNKALETGVKVILAVYLQSIWCTHIHFFGLYGVQKLRAIKNAIWWKKYQTVMHSVCCMTTLNLRQ